MISTFGNILNTKNIILCDNNCKQESFVEYFVTKYLSTINYLFIVCDKQYYYHKNQRWYTPYMKISNFEFKLKDIDKLFTIIESINDNIIVILDVGYLNGQKKERISQYIDKLYNMNNVTLLFCMSQFSHLTKRYKFDNIIFDSCISMSAKSIYELIDSKSNYDMFKKLVIKNIDMNQFYLYKNDILSMIVTDADSIKKYKKYHIKKMMCKLIYKEIRKLNNQPSKKLIKQWDEDKTQLVYSDSEDMMTDGFRFS